MTFFSITLIAADSRFWMIALTMFVKLQILDSYQSEVSDFIIQFLEYLEEKTLKSINDHISHPKNSFKDYKLTQPPKHKSRIFILSKKSEYF